MAWKRVGDAGEVSVEVDRDTGKIELWSTPDNSLVLNVIDAAHLAILLDEAVAVAKGDGVKLDKDLG